MLKHCSCTLVLFHTLLFWRPNEPPSETFTTQYLYNLMQINITFDSCNFLFLDFCCLLPDSLASVLYLTTSLMMMPIFGIFVDRYGPRTASCFGFVLCVNPHVFLWILSKCRSFKYEVYLILSLLFIGGKHPGAVRISCKRNNGGSEI